MKNDEKKNVEVEEMNDFDKCVKKGEEVMNPVVGFFEANKKWFIIGGCILGGILLGGGGAMVLNEAKKREQRDNDEMPFDEA